MRFFFIARIITSLSINMLLCCESQHILLNSISDLIPIQGTRLHVYDRTSGAGFSGRCALQCAQRRYLTPSCEAFRHVASSEECELFKTTGALVNSSNVIVFEIRMRDTFHNILVGDRMVSISYPTGKKNYQDARDHCERFGGYLIQMDSPEKYSIAQIIAGGPTDVYVGASDIQVEGQWVSDRDGSPIDMGAWQWRSGEPNGVLSSNENCVFFQIITNHGLNDVPCHLVESFMCERDV